VCWIHSLGVHGTQNYGVLLTPFFYIVGMGTVEKYINRTDEDLDQHEQMKQMQRMLWTLNFVQYMLDSQSKAINTVSNQYLPIHNLVIHLILPSLHCIIWVQTQHVNQTHYHPQTLQNELVYTALLYI